MQFLSHYVKDYDFDLDTPFDKYPKKIHDILIYGTNGKTIKVYYKGQRGEESMMLHLKV